MMQDKKSLMCNRPGHTTLRAETTDSSEKPPRYDHEVPGAWHAVIHNPDKAIRSANGKDTLGKDIDQDQRGHRGQCK